MLDTMIKNLQEKTGKSLQDWIGIVQKSGLSKHGEVIAFLKSEHGFTHGYANLVAHSAKEAAAGSAPADDDLIDTQYRGKESLRPVYDVLIKAIEKFGEDVEVAPKKAYVSLRRKKQFALVQPSTKTRVDLGLNLKGVEPEGALEASGSFNSMCSHRVRLQNPDDVTPQVLGWLRDAYDNAG